ncbi:MAG: hypothetical protein QOE24_3049 [Frankiales bacterium]|nr:hypothetical protein [Frankiales bacterium]
MIVTPVKTPAGAPTVAGPDELPRWWAHTSPTVTLLALGLAAVLGLLPTAGTVTAPPAVGRVLFHLADPRIAESSGIAEATREPGVWFTHNDSGDPARFFALGPTGRTLATYVVDNAANIDWEDMAAARSPTGVPTLWFADTGDNQQPRASVEVYAVPEPGVYPGLHGTTVHVRAVGYRFRYPDGAHDAEALLVDPHTARIYIATKSYDGVTEVYAGPAAPADQRLNEMTLLTTLDWYPAHAEPTLIDVPGALATTGGAFSADGRTLVLRTYTDAYLFHVDGPGPEALKAGLSGERLRLRLPRQPQGEGICFRRDGKALVVSSERVGSAVDQVVLPAAGQTAVQRPEATSAATVATAPAGAQPTTSPAPQANPVPARHSSRLAPAAAAVVVVVIALAAWQLRRRHAGPARSSR